MSKKQEKDDMQKIISVLIFAIVFFILSIYLICNRL